MGGVSLGRPEGRLEIWASAIEQYCRELQIDRAVREGVKRTLDEGIARWALDSDYAVRAYFMPNIILAWYVVA